MQYAVPADTIYNDSFFYNSAGQLEKISGKGYVTTFTYAANGQVDEVNQFVRSIGKDSLMHTRYYKHTYTAQGKIATMYSRLYAENFNRWVTDDSLVNSFTPAGDYDTGYWFVPNNNWELTLDHRLVYGLASMSITPVKLTLIKNIYPNPVTDKITVEFQQLPQQDISITDITGKTIHRFAVSDLITEIPLDIPPGIYFIHADGLCAKFIKQ